jgi:hypothetical protein
LQWFENFVLLVYLIAYKNVNGHQHILCLIILSNEM